MYVLQVRTAMNAQMVQLDTELQEVKAARDQLAKYKVRQPGTSWPNKRLGSQGPAGQIQGYTHLFKVN